MSCIRCAGHGGFAPTTSGWEACDCHITANTKMITIAEKYGCDFGNDNELEVTKFLEKRGYKSLAKLLKSDSTPPASTVVEMKGKII